MSKQIVNQDEQIAILNQELKKLPGYEEGMEVIGVPVGYSGSELSGYDFNGPEYTRGLVALAVKSFKQKYELRVT
jgi:hypothetical protein